MKALCLALLLTLVSGPAWAASYFVATTGSNANSCAAAQDAATPKQTLSSAMACWSLGDTVWVAPGTYTDVGIGSLFLNGISDVNRTALRATIPGTVTLRPVTSGQAVVIDNKDFVFMEGIVIDAINAGNDALKLQNGSDNILLDRMQFTNSQTQGLLCQQSNNGRLWRSRSNGNGNKSVNAQLWHGIYLNTGCDDWDIGWNELDGNSQMGIQMYNSPKRTNFHDNFVHGNCQKVGNGGSEIIVAHQDQVLTRNIVWSSGDCTSGITINLSTPARARLDHNTVICTGSCGSNGIRVSPGNTGVVLRNNLSLGWGTNISDAGTGTTLTTNRSTGTLSAILQDAANGNFSVVAGSATINAGTNIGDTFCSTAPDQGHNEVCGPASASVDGRTLDLTLSTAAAPWIAPGTTGWSVGCTGTGCGTPTVNSVSVITGTPGLIRLDIAGITGDACAAGQTWTATYNSATGSVTDSRLTGNSKNQKLLSFTNFAVTNNCAVGGGGGGGGDEGPTMPGTPYAHYRFNGNANDSTVNARHGTITGTSYVTAKYGQGVQTDLGDLDYVQLPFGGSVNPTSTSITVGIGFWIDPADLGANRSIVGTTLSGDTRLYILRSNGTFRLGVQDYAAASSSDLSEQAGWNYVCLTMNSATNTAALWANGKQGSADSVSRTYTSYTTAGNWRVGYVENFATVNAPGHIYDEVVFYQGSVESCSALQALWDPPVSPWTGNIAVAAAKIVQVKVNVVGARVDIGAVNTAVTVPNYGAFAAVFQVDGTVADPSPIGYSVYYECASCPSNGVRTAVPNVASADGVRFFTAQELNRITGVEANLTGSLTQVGGAVHSTAGSVDTPDLAQDNSTIQTFLLAFDGATVGRQYCFYLHEQTGIELDGHTPAGGICVTAGQAQVSVGF